jgi:hypothetical protein
VAERERRFRHWAGFENFAVFTVEEGDLEEEEITQTLRSQIDREWQWRLLKMDDYRYLVKFPPHIRVESKVLGKATYFYLKNDEVMASLRVWDGDIEPVGHLKETWVQITGVPPKQCDWETIKEIASSLGKLLEIDWQSLFSSFFSIARVKINCKDPKAIPESRVMELADQLFLIHFKVEDLEMEEGRPPEEGGEGDSSGEDKGSPDDPEDPQKPEGDGNLGKGDMDKDKPAEGGNRNKDKTSGVPDQGAKSVKKMQHKTSKLTEQNWLLNSNHMYKCVDLLQVMELNEEVERKGEEIEEEGEERLPLPKEWTYSVTETWEKEGSNEKRTQLDSQADEEIVTEQGKSQEGEEDQGKAKQNWEETMGTSGGGKEKQKTSGRWEINS